MTRPPASPPPSLIGRLAVETPEHVRLEYELAGVGSRLTAAILDQLILALWGLAVIVVLLVLALAWRELAVAIWIVTFVLGTLAYYTLFEAFRAGQTPGKRWTGIRVVRETGHPVTFGAALLRNLLRLADLLPPPYLTGFFLVLFHPRSQRLGDLVAGTVVVRDRPETAPPDLTPPRPLARPEPVSELVGPPLDDAEWRLLATFLERAGGLAPEVRFRLEDQISARFAERFPVRPRGAAAFLLALHRSESARRSGALGVVHRGRTDAGQRLTDTQAARWTAFERIAERAGRAGLDALAAEELPDFAARYRAVAADLARARTYGADPLQQARLERMVAAGHNLLYRAEHRGFRRIGEVVLRECPAAVVRSWRAVLLALAALFLPAAGGYATLRAHPEIAAEVLPESMLERADAGHQREAEGRGYFEADAADRPVLATQIITNNVQVSFYCFAGGAFLGIGSLVALAFNGLELGATAGHFANQGLFHYLFAFIVGHGILELFAISVSGAAGFLLGLALLAPGDLSRAEALQLRGRIAVRMIGAVVVLLVVAGLIEGLASASTASFAYRVAVSSASGVFLILYLANGARWLDTVAPPPG